MQRSESIPAGGATSVQVVIGMAVGQLKVAGGATELMEADFTYDEKLVPTVSYRVENNEGVLDIEQSSDRNVTVTRNEWDIRLNNDIPVHLRANLAAADATFDLDVLRTVMFDVRSASGSVKANLAGPQPALRVVETVTASGDIALQLNGDYAALTTLHTRSASGQTDLTFGKNWQDDLDARIESVSGNVILRVPRDIGVIIGLSTISGRVDTRSAGSFQAKGRTFSNAVLGSTDATLQFRVSTISGGITIIETD